MIFVSLIAFVVVVGCNASIAQTPPRGWNSYDSYCWSVNEEQVLENAKAVQKDLLPHGYEYIVIDYLWYVDITNKSHTYIDDYGRPLPDPHRFPHSQNGTGFKWLADQIHSMRLKFGIHIMRGLY